jgi:hypothetical protein
MKKIIVLGAALTTPNGNEIVGTDALFRLLSDEFSPFQTVCGSLQRRVQMVYDFSEKTASVHDLIEKNIAENDLVYVLTEIDTSVEYLMPT